MNTFKKIAAVAMAAATLATTMISVSAYDLPTSSWRNVKLTADYQFKTANVPEVDYFDLYWDSGLHYFEYTNVTGTITEGKKILRINPLTSAYITRIEEELPIIKMYDKAGNNMNSKYTLQAVVSDWRKGTVDIIAGGKSYLRSAYERESFKYVTAGYFEHKFTLEGMALVGIPEICVGGKKATVVASNVTVKNLIEDPSTTISYQICIPLENMNKNLKVTINGVEVDTVYTKYNY